MDTVHFVDVGDASMQLCTTHTKDNHNSGTTATWHETSVSHYLPYTVPPCTQSFQQPQEMWERIYAVQQIICSGASVHTRGHTSTQAQAAGSILLYNVPSHAILSAATRDVRKEASWSAERS